MTPRRLVDGRGRDPEYRQRLRARRRPLHLEKLDERTMLAADLPTLGSAGSLPLPTVPRFVTPAWFESVSTETLSAAATVRLSWGGDTVEAYAEQWIVQLRSTSLAGIHSASQALDLFSPDGPTIVRGLGLEGQLLMHAPGWTFEAARDWFATHPHVEWFEPNFVYTVEQTPNDPSFAQLWGLHNTGQSGGTTDADIDAPEAWDLVTGSANVVIGVIDTGVDYNHPDLAANMWRNPGEIAGNSIDDDGNGFVDDVVGYDFAHYDSNPMDDHRHGTHVAGTIAGVGNNATGVSGVNWTSSIMALKFLNASGSGATSGAVSAVNYATMMRATYGVNVALTNNSWGGGNYSQALLDAIAAHGNAGLLFIAAAGNQGRNNNTSPEFPSSYPLENIISVAATDRRDTLAYFSNYGSTAVDLAAPGVGIYSTVLNGSYATFDGTSMAAPHVAGVAALAWAYSPSSSAGQIRSALLGGVDIKPALAGIVATGGRLNARGTLDLLGMNVLATSPAQGERLAEPPTSFTVDFTHPYDPASIAASDFSVAGIPADTFTLVDSDTILFSFATSPVGAEGPQTMLIAAGAIQEAAGSNIMEAWQGLFYYDPTPLAVTSTTPTEGQALTAHPILIVLNFSEAIDPASVDLGDLSLDFGNVTDVIVVDGNTIAFAVSGLTREGVVKYALADGAIRDLFGTPGLGFSGNFSLDDPLTQRYDAVGLPIPIVDNGVTLSTITIAEPVTIADVDVHVQFLHPYAADLDVFLIAPDGTQVELFTDVGGSGDNFTGTVLDDEASAAVASGVAPFTGRFRPEGSLAAFDGFNALGIWTLRVIDDTPGAVGVMEGWALSIADDLDISPRISSVQPLPADGAPTWSAIDALTVRFSEVMEPASVNNLAHWSLVEAGADQLFDTADDAIRGLTLAAPYVGGLTATLNINGGELSPGKYRFEAASGGLKDLLGNLLDENSDGAGGDAYRRTFEMRAQASAIPFVEDFEAGSLPALGGYWEFRAGSDGRAVVSSGNAPHGGAYHLLLDQTAAYAGAQSATLHLNLAGKSNLTLDFWQKQFGDSFDATDDRVQVSANGVAWHTLVSLTGANSEPFWQHHSFNLDAVIAALGIAYTNDFQIRFSQDNYYLASGGFAFDDIRISQLDFSGPRIISHSPTGNTGAPVNAVTVVFNEPIDAATFTVDDVVVVNPAGAPVALTGNPVSGGDQRTFTITFASQSIAGNYTFRIGPDINDLAGNAMNQDNDGIPGETNGQDDYDGSFSIGPPLAQSFPYLETFAQVGLENLPGWRFSSLTGIIDVSAENQPYAGNYHLRLVGDPNITGGREVVWVMDLTSVTGATDLALDFWMQQVDSTSGSVSVAVSNNGTTWSTLSGGSSVKNSTPNLYEHFSFDLDAALTQSNIARDADVYFRLSQSSSSFTKITTFDNVRISQTDVFGPRVLAHQANNTAPSFTVTFNEPIDPASFTAADIEIIGPTGYPVGILGNPLASPDQHTFTIQLAEVARGSHTLVIGPHIHDLAGNLMNQDNDAVAGETNGADDYNGTFVWGPPAAQTVPYSQDFEVASISQLAGLSFSVTGTATTDLSTSDQPHSGASHLSFAQTSSGNQIITLLLDLSDQVGAADLELDFWLQPLQTSNSLSVHVSGNGTTYTTLASSLSPPLGQYTRLAFDLDAALASASIALDSDVYIRFTHNGFGSSYRMTLDDIRVSDVDVFGPRVTSQLASNTTGSFTVTFSEPIDPATFTASDVVVTGPAGYVVPLVGHPVPDGDNRTFTIQLASSVVGNYALRINADVRDFAGNRMNQDNDPITGETNGADDYVGTFKVGPPIAQAFPYVQDFESGDLAALAGWSFGTSGAATIAVTDADNPRGTHQLLFSQPSVGTQQAVLVLDLSSESGATDLALDFWIKAIGSNASLTLQVSGNGVTFQSVSQGTNLTSQTLGQYSRLSYDLDAILASANIALDSDVYISFSHTSGSSTQKVTLDDIRVSRVDVFGPRIVAPPQVTSSSEFTVTFDEPIDPATFTAQDLTLVGPTGHTVALVGTPVPSADQRTFTMRLASGVPGTYALRIGPEVRDVSGNLMNQDSDPRAGEATQDSFAGTFELGPPPAQTLPYSQGFESGSAHDLPGWSFGVIGPATIDVINGLNPKSGSFHLQFNKTAPGMNYAAVRLDLTPYVGETDLALDFWVQTIAAASNTIKLEVSGDGVTWGTFPNATTSLPNNAYTQLVIDLDQALQHRSIEFDDSVYVRFAHDGTGAQAAITIDDFRVSQLDLMGPRVVSQSTVSPAGDFTITFDEPIVPATFTAEDLVIEGPTGTLVTLVGNPVASADQRTFTLTLASQTPGLYRVKIGPDVRDVAGNIMNQDGDALTGESGVDLYASTLTISPLVPVTVPHWEGFESGSFAALPGWSFSVSEGGLTTLTADHNPRGGRHLKFEQLASGTQQAVLWLDLTDKLGVTDLALDFWVQTLASGASSNSLDVHVSGDGLGYFAVSQGTSLYPSLPNQYTRYAFDLDAALASAGIVHDGSVYVRFTHKGSTATHQLTIDDIQVSQLDVFGPRILSAAATAGTNEITVTFSEPIVADSFTAADVFVTGPAGYPIGLRGDPVPSADQRTFTFHVDSNVFGSYTLRIGPEISDLTGNWMNQDNDPVSGEANLQDDYDVTLTLGPPVAQTFPYLQDFEAGHLELLPGWSFSTSNGGKLDLFTGNNPQSGAYHARWTGSVQSTLLLDLSGQAGATNLTLDFWMKSLQSASTNIQVSGNGTSFNTLYSSLTPPVGQYAQYGIDLDAALAARGIALDGDVYLRFSHSGSGVLDDVRISISDASGPYVQSFVANPSAYSLDVTFNEPIDVATFTAADVTITGPTGYPFALVGDPLPSADHRTFTLQLATQVRGEFSFVLGPNIRDTFGNWMNQDQDPLSGEVEDKYSGKVTLGLVTPQPVPYLEGFEYADLGELTGWSFGFTQSALTALSDKDDPHGGSRHLDFSQSSAGFNTAVFAIDLSNYVGATDLSLDFWLQSTGTATGGDYINVDISGNGTAFNSFSSGIGLRPTGLGNYERFAFDLDALLTQYNIARDGDVYIRLTRISFGNSYKMTLDDVRVSNVDVFGPRIISHTVTDGNAVQIVFDEPIDAATFTAGDIAIKGPTGTPVALVGEPVAEADNRTFTIQLASHVIGAYTIQIGSDVRDAAGNRLNQDNDAVSGETNGQDNFAGAFVIGPAVAQTLPYHQGFEGNDLSQLPGWSFSTDGDAQTNITADHAPRGDYHLQFHQGSGGNQNATLKLDLSDHVGATDLALDFWLKKIGTTSSIYLDVSGDGATWKSATSGSSLAAPLPLVYTHYAFDLDAVLAGAGIVLDDDVYIRLRNSGPSANYRAALDDVRVSTLDLFGPRVVSHSPELTNNAFTITFNEAIDPATLNAALSVIGPTGLATPLAGDPVPSADQRTFTVALASNIAGTYRFSISPIVTDLAGNPMNQDNDVLMGETNGHDGYAGVVKRNAVVPQTIPYTQGFESGELGGLAGWSFDFVDAAATELVENSEPHGGDWHLKFGQPVSGTQQATLRLDLSSHIGATNLTLDFWLQSLFSTSSNYVSVALSGNGETFVTIPTGNQLSLSPENSYAHFAFDLDAALAGAGIVLDEDVYVRFSHRGTSATHEMTLDDVRVGFTDVLGPRISSQMLVTSGDSFTVTFDEPIDPSTFTAADVVIGGPTGFPVSLVGDPVPNADQRTFTLRMATSLAGSYSYRIGPSIADAAGNLMNQNGDPRAGQINDFYLGTLQVSPPAAQAFPYVQDFEGGDALALAGWSFAVSNATIAVTPDDPHSGTYHLKFQPSSSGTAQASLLLDLSSQVSATNLSLDFSVQTLLQSANNSFSLAASNDGANWTVLPAGSAITLPATNVYQHFVYDLDTALASVGVIIDEDVYLRIEHLSSSGTRALTLDDFRVSNLDLFGPRVTSHQATGAQNSFTITFNEPVDAASFTAADLVIVGPTGQPVALAQPPVPQGDQRTFTIHLASTILGDYSFRLGPEVYDLAGNPMNQDGDSLMGETNGNDEYSQTFVLGPPAAQAFPYAQGFESGNIVGLPGWTFSTTSTATTGIIGTDGPRDAYHLHFSGNGTQTATLLLDLSNQVAATDLSLDFWAQALYSTSLNTLSVMFSGDGSNWWTAPSLTLPAAQQYTHYAFDLDAMLTTAGIARDSSVYVRFRHSGSLPASMTLDDVRISNLDVFGPKIVSQAPTGLIAGPLTALTVVFDEPIAANSFTAADVTIVGPDGFPVPVLGDPVAGADNRTFTIPLNTALSGSYSFRIGSDVLDVAGNRMNQDGDAYSGETNGQDDYSGVFQLGPPVAQTIPYVQDFEAADLSALAGFTWNATGSTTFALTSGDNPHGGTQHLKLDSTASVSGNHEFVLMLDLSDHVGATDLALDFWMKTLVSNSSSNSLSLRVSGNGSSYFTVSNASSLRPVSLGEYTRFAVDLDAALAFANIGIDKDIYIQFAHGGFSPDYELLLDDLRVSRADVFGPQVTGFGPMFAEASSLSSFTITFNEPIDPTTFTSEQIVVTSPVGQILVLDGDPVPSADQRTFTVSFAAAQTLSGGYHFRLNSSVRDLAGNPLNQDGDFVGGETNGDDTYVNTVRLWSADGLALPVWEGFEGEGIAAMAGWSFETTGNSRVELAPSPTAYSGDSQLRFWQTANGTSTASAILHLDLTEYIGATNLTLDFWSRRVGSITSSTLYVSGDGVNWTSKLSFSPSSAGVNYHYALDLDQALAGIALDGDVYLRFTSSLLNSTSEVMFDQVRVKAGALNNAPTLNSSGSLSGAIEDTDFTITFDYLAQVASESDANGDPLLFRIDAVQSGTLLKNGLPIVPRETFLAPGEALVWRPPPDVNGTPFAFDIRVFDGDLYSGTTQAMRVVIAAVNDAPVMDNSGDAKFPNLPEDAAVNIGMLVSELLNSVSPITMFTDVDSSSSRGIAVIGVDTTHGVWEYSTNSGSTWSAFDAPTDSTALLLSTLGSRIRFRPAANFHGTITDGIRFRLWDRSSGINGNLADTTVNGGTTPFSVGTETASITVTSVFDPPVEITLAGASVAEGNAGAVIGELTVTDVDLGDVHTFTLSDARFVVNDGVLQLKPGVSLDFEEAAAVSVQVTATDTGGLSLTRAFVITVADVAEPPLGVWLSGNTIIENRPAGIVTSLFVQGFDPDFGDMLSYAVSDDRFEIVDQQLRIVPGRGFTFAEFELVTLEITATDTTALAYSESFTITVRNANLAPQAVAITHPYVDENQPGASVGMVAVLDPDTGDAHTITTSDARFIVDAGMLRLQPGERLDFETTPRIDLTLTATDATGASTSSLVTIEVRDLAEAPSSLVVSRRAVYRELVGAWIAALAVHDPDVLNEHQFVVDDPRFEVRNGHLYVRADRSLTEPVGAEVPLTITVRDVLAGADVSTMFTFRVEDAPSNWDAAHQWRANPFDVNADGRVTPLDALLVIQQLNAHGPATLAPQGAGTVAPLFYDVSGDHALTPLDALLVINRINAQGAEPANGEAANNAHSFADAVDDVFIADENWWHESAEADRLRQSLAWDLLFSPRKSSPAR